MTLSKKAQENLKKLQMGRPLKKGKSLSERLVDIQPMPEEMRKVFSSNTSCPHCSGRGREDSGSQYELCSCKTCRGKGAVRSCNTGNLAEIALMDEVDYLGEE